MAGQAAVTLIDPQRMVWNFTLTPGAGSDPLDQFFIDFGDDKLDAGDLLSVTVHASGQSVPVISTTLSRSGPGGLGVFIFLRDLNNAFPDMTGTVSLELLQGSVDIDTLSFRLTTPSGNWASSVRGRVHLAPEPSVVTLVGIGAALALRRRRRQEPAEPSAERRS